MDLKLSMTFFSNWKYSVSNKIIGRLFICIQVVVLAVAFWNLFFLLRGFVMLFSVFDLLLQSVFLRTLSSYFF